MGHSSPALQRTELSTFLITAHLQHPMNRTPRSSISAAPGHLHLMAQWALGTSTGTSQHRNTINAASPLAPCILPLRNTLFIIPVVHQTWPVLRMISCWGVSGASLPPPPLLPGFPFPLLASDHWARSEPSLPSTLG